MKINKECVVLSLLIIPGVFLSWFSVYMFYKESITLGCILYILDILIGIITIIYTFKITKNETSRGRDKPK